MTMTALTFIFSGSKYPRKAPSALYCFSIRNRLHFLIIREPCYCGCACSCSTYVMGECPITSCAEAEGEGAC